MTEADLLNLYATRSTGKLSDKWTFYLREYARIFAPYRALPLCLLEVGVQNGGSLEVWADYFENASVLVGCDINAACGTLAYTSPKVRVVVGDVNNEPTQSAILAEANAFDIIIDDGSHTSPDIINTFCSFFPHLNDGGVYVIEDLHAVYWEQYRGGLFAPHSAMAFFKSLTDISNRDHWGLDFSVPDFFSSLGFTFKQSLAALTHIHRIEFMNSMCVIYKAGPDVNALGPRMVSGDDETICPILTRQGEINKPPAQTANPWAQPPRYESRLNELTNLMILREKEIDALRCQHERAHVELVRAEAQLTLLKELWLGDGSLETL